MGQFAPCWEGLEDLCSGNAKLSDLCELPFIPLCTVLRGGQNAVDIAESAVSELAFLRDCGSAWNKDPANGVIGVQAGPPW